jgi:hypothetical protein
MRLTLAVVMLTLQLGGCATQVTREVDRLSIAEPLVMMETTSYQHGGIRLSPADGFWISLQACGLNAVQRLCGTVYLAAGRSLQIQEPRFTLLDSATEKSEDLAFDSLAFESRCTLPPPRIDVPYSTRLAQNACPSDSDDLKSVEGPVNMELLDQRVEATTTTVFKRFSFAANLRFRGENAGIGGSSDPAQYVRQYRFTTRSAKHFKAGEDVIVVPPRIRLDGQEIDLPRLRLHTQTETSYRFRELM